MKAISEMKTGLTECQAAAIESLGLDYMRIGYEAATIRKIEDLNDHVAVEVSVI